MQISSITVLKGSKHLTKFLFCLILRNLVFKGDDCGSLSVTDNMCSSVLLHMDLLKWLRCQRSVFIHKIKLQIPTTAQTNVSGQSPLSKTLNMAEYSRKGLELLLTGTYATNAHSM